MRRPAARVAVVCALGVLASVGASACTTAGSTPGGSSSATTPGVATAPGAATTEARTPGPTASTPTAPLVVETVFDHATLDPTRQFERSGALVSKALYATLTTFGGDDGTTPVPGLAEFTMSPEGKWLTLRIRKGVLFSDGSPVTTDDVIFTLARARGLGGSTAAMLGTVSATRVDDRTLTLTSSEANFALPAILANPSLGILNADVVRANGATIGPADTAQRWFDDNSAGSGPYLLGPVAKGSITLIANPFWSGSPVAFPQIVLRNASPARQKADLESGTADVALDLSPAQAAAMRARPSATPLTLQSEQSSSLAFLLLNRSKQVNPWTANPNFAEAVRLGIDREALGRATGEAMPALGLIPSGLVGALTASTVNPAPAPTVVPTAPGATPGTTATPTAPTAPSATAPLATPLPTRDVPAAKAALARSGYRGQPIPLTFARDLPIQGVPTATIAVTLQKQLAEVGIRLTLAPAPAAKALASYRAGADAMGLWGWNPDYLDPENYLAFAPGGLVAKRARWPLGADADLEELAGAARSAYGADRAQAYTAWQVAMNARSPFVPLLQPMSHLAHGARVSELATSPVWTLDLAALR